MTRRLCCILLTVLLTVNCSKIEEEPETPLTLSLDMAVLRSGAGATGAVTVTAIGPWSLTTSGSGYRINPREGGAGSTEIVLSTDTENATAERRKLGSVTLHMGGVPALSFDVVQSPIIAPATMLLYMPGWSLMSFYNANIEGIKAAVNTHTPGDGRILVCYQPSSYVNSAKLCEIAFDARKQACDMILLKTYDNFAASNPEDVRQMLSDMALLAPAQRYGVTVGCHGKAWVPASSGALSSQRTHVADEWTPLPEALPTRSFGDPGYEIDIEQFAQAIEAQSFELDYLIFDACFMANIETLYDLRNTVKRVVSSPCEIMAAGFPYKRIIPALFSNDGWSCRLEKACEEFYNFYMYDWQSVRNNAQSGCISLAEMSQMEALAAIMRRLNALPQKSYSTVDVQNYEGFRTHLFFDMMHYALSAWDDQALLDELRTQLSACFPLALHTPSFYSAFNNKMNPVTHYSGVSISEPSTRYVPENRQTSWYRGTH